MGLFAAERKRDPLKKKAALPKEGEKTLKRMMTRKKREK